MILFYLQSAANKWSVDCLSNNFVQLLPTMRCVWDLHLLNMDF